MRVFLSILALLTTSFFSLAQSTEPCSADELHAAEMAASEPYARNFDAVRAAVQRLQASSNRNMDVYTLPVVVHVIHRGSSVGVEENISDAQILSAIDGMNDDFRNRVSDSEGADTFIQFEMARRTPTGEPTNGIVRVDGSSVPGYAEHGISNGQDDDAADQTAVKSLTTWFGDDYINIFVVPEINGNDGGNGVQGFAYLGPTNDARDGIVVIYNAFGLVGELKPGRTLNKTITHQMGHHLSLYHTFSNTTSCTSETNCEVQGDLVCDTPATIANTFGCTSPTCDGAQVENYMDYAQETCKNMFSAGQRDRMRACLESSRSSLLESWGGIPVSGRDLGIVASSNVGESTCLSSFTPSVIVTNFGSQTLTGFELTASINGLTPFTTVHEESVSSGTSLEAMLPELALAAGTNELNLGVRLLGGGQDDFQDNDSLTRSIELVESDYWTMTLNTDTWANEISWRIEDSEGEAIMSGGNYPVGAATYVSGACVPLGCHTLIMEDTNGDGLCSIDFSNDGSCDIGGSMSLTNAAGDVLVELDNTDNNYGSIGSWEVCASEVLAAEECEDQNSNGICDAAEVYGCQDVTACNFTPGSILDDGSCTFAEQYYGCEGNCLDDADGDGVCDELEVAGCADSNACNYVVYATDDDGTCEFTSCAGCIDPNGCNYDPDATISGGCDYPATHYNCIGNCLNDADGDGLCDELEGSDVIQSVQDGFWHEPSTWDCACVPEGGRIVVVSHDVVMASDVEFSTLVLSEGALSAATEVTLTFDGDLLATGTNAQLPNATLHVLGNGAQNLVVGNWAVREVHVSNESTLTIYDSLEVNGHIQIDGSTVVVYPSAQLLLTENEFGRATVIRTDGGSVEGLVTRQIILPATPNRNMSFVEQRIAIGLEGVQVSELVGDIPTWGFAGADDPSGFSNIGFWSADADFNYAIVESVDDILPVWEGVYLALSPAESYTLTFSGSLPASDVVMDFPADAFTALFGNATNANVDLQSLTHQFVGTPKSLDCWNTHTLQFDHFIDGLSTNGLRATLQPNATCQFLPDTHEVLAFAQGQGMPNGTFAENQSEGEGRVTFSVSNSSDFRDEVVVVVREGAQDAYVDGEDAINTSSLFSACDLYVLDSTGTRMGIAQIGFDSGQSVSFDLMLGANRPLDGNYVVEVEDLHWPCGTIAIQLSGESEAVPLSPGPLMSISLDPTLNNTQAVGSLVFTPFDPSAPGTCGECFDPGACNFEPNASVPNNDLCLYAVDLYPTGLYDCDGHCYDDLDGDGTCNALEIAGCQDPNACNYDPDATDPAEPLNPCIYLSGDNDGCDGITFNVDMACAPSDFVNVFVTGPWCGWCANDSYNTMSDFDGDGVYSVTIPDLFGNVEYKYAINGFAGQENLVNDMVNGGECAPITDFDAYANRTILANDGVVVYDYYGTCDGECNDAIPGPPGLVTFYVDMAGYQGSFNTVNLNGSFNGWCGSCASMTDEDGDGVFSCDVELNGGAIEYKFTVDGWTDFEMLEVGAACTVTLDGYTNRTLEVSGDEELPIVCWNSCHPCIPGCTDADACNYDQTVDFDNGSCFYAELYYDCDGACLNDSDNDGVCDELEIAGCTDESALNFDEDATDNDESCVWVGSNCEVSDALFEVVNELSILPFEPSEVTFGLDTIVNLVVALPAVVSEPASGNPFNAISFAIETIQGMPPGMNAGSLPPTILAAGTACLALEGTPQQEGWFDLSIEGQLNVSLFGQPISLGEMSITHPVFVGANPNPIPGCTYPWSVNFLNYATQDDGSCILAGCTDPSACNHQPLAQVDDGFCLYECFGCTYEGAINFEAAASRDDGSCEFDAAPLACSEDLNNDGHVGSSDLIALLAGLDNPCGSP